jgi:23S rRNA U2552 (ribose-2'-O)-methylase RlmE/FtsJ
MDQRSRTEYNNNNNNNNNNNADDQVIIADTEDNLQKAAYKLNQITTEYGLLYQYRKQNRWHLKDGIH